MSHQPTSKTRTTLLLLLFFAACTKTTTPPPISPPPQPTQQPTPEPTPEPPKSHLHPASKEKDYPLYALDEITQDPNHRTLIDDLRTPTNGARVLSEIKPMGLTGTTLLSKSLRSTHREIRMQSALILANLKTKDDAAIQALNEAILQDPDPDVRATAAKSFVLIKTNKAIPNLIRSLKEDPFETARANAAWALGATKGTPEVINALKQSLKDPETWVRLRSASSLKKLKAQSAIPNLIEALDDTNPMVQERAHDALKSITKKSFPKDAQIWKKSYPN